MNGNLPSLPGLCHRREALRRIACGFGSLAFAGMALPELLAGPSPVPHLVPRAKRVIFLYMQGGPSQVDTFDYKPRLQRENGQKRAFDDPRTIANTGQRGTEQRVLGSPWDFRQHGQSGRWVSGLFPETARHVDRLCFLHSVQTEGVAHGPATLFLHCGSSVSLRPSLGAWVSYGLGTENRSLPAFVTISPSLGNGGARNYGNAFLPADHQGSAIGLAGLPARELGIRNLGNPQLSRAEQQRQFQLVQALNGAQRPAGATESEADALIRSYELAWRMQSEVPRVLDLRGESLQTQALYGIGEPATDDYGRQCLMARQLCEAGVRFIQVTYGDNTANPRWDQHQNLPKHAEHARAVDKPIAGLLTDLADRGLLEDTLVWWGSEFGRTPYAEKDGTGRDHNPGAFTVWLAGGGVKPGFGFGATDDYGHRVVEGAVHMHDLHATLLYLLGLDHERLTFRYDGRDFRLTDVAGRLIREIIA